MDPFDGIMDANKSSGHGGQGVGYLPRLRRRQQQRDLMTGMTYRIPRAHNARGSIISGPAIRNAGSTVMGVPLSFSERMMRGCGCYRPR